LGLRKGTEKRKKQRKDEQEVELKYHLGASAQDQKQNDLLLPNVTTIGDVPTGAEKGS